MNGNLPNPVVVSARAKVNAFLRVLGRRPDGYHEVESLIVPISLADRLEIHAMADPVQFSTLSISLDVGGDPELVQGVPLDESNLVLKAALALAERARPRGFADIVLEKRVPAAAGLGGGSADAAATLRALNDLWGLGLDEASLLDVAATVGSDVPALLHGTAVLVGGRGERVKRTSVPPSTWALVTFGFGVSTADAYRWWDEEAAGGEEPVGPAVVELEEGIPDLTRLAELLANDLEGPVARRHPEVGRARELLLAGGSMGAVMSGSGPSVAGLLPPERSRLDPEAEEELAELSGRPVAYVTSESGLDKDVDGPSIATDRELGR